MHSEWSWCWLPAQLPFLEKLNGGWAPSQAPVLCSGWFSYKSKSEVVIVQWRVNCDALSLAVLCLTAPALQGGVVSAVSDVSFWGKQSCINYRLCSRCLGQILILFLNVSNGMVVLEGVFIMGIHSGCDFWYFKAELVELWVDDCVLHWFGVSLRRNAGFWCCGTFSLIHCRFRRGTDCVFIFRFSFAFILYENTCGMCELLLTCCILSVPIKSITLFKRPVSEGEKWTGNNQCACNTRLPLTSIVSSLSWSYYCTILRSVCRAMIVQHMKNWFYFFFLIRTSLSQYAHVETQKISKFYDCPLR